MIVDPRTVVGVFLAGVSAFVALAACGAAMRASFASGVRVRRGEAPQRSAWDAHGPLLGLLLAALTVLQLIGVPLFYLVLQGYVPGLAERGVMCAFGVTRIQPELVRATQVLGPAALYASALWLALVSASGTREAEGGGARPVHAFLALCCGGLALASNVVALAYYLAPKDVADVTCCGTITGAAAAALRLGAEASDTALGSHASFWSTQSLFALGLVWRATCARANASSRGPSSWIAEAAPAALGLVAASTAYLFWRDTLAPEVLGLPYHRCVYELLTETRALGLAALCALLASMLATWPFWLRLAGDTGVAGTHAARASLVLLASSLLPVIMHLL